MIVKKVQTKKAAAPKAKALHARDLCDYIAGPNAGDEDEKVQHRGAVNLLNIDHDAQVREIADLAEVAKRSPQPLQHWILSWRQGEQPTAGQADQAVRIFLDEMGLGGNQAIYALHRNTDNCHLHLAVNRVDQETERVVTVNGGFDIEVAHRAIARIEHEQGWQREREGRYQVIDDGVVERSAKSVRLEREPTSRARDFENLTGQKSAQRIAIEEGAELIRRAQSWRELHSRLADQGMRFEQKGSGAVLWVGNTAVKASTAGRDCSMSALERRLGDFVPAPAALDLKPDAPEPVAPAAPGWSQYSAERQDHYAAKKLERDDLTRRRQEAWQRMADRQREERRDILGGNWSGKGEALNALRSVLAMRQAQEKAELREQQDVERATLRERFPQWPAFEEWLRDRGSPELAERWRFRERTPAIIVGDGVNGGDAANPTRPRDIRAFTGEVNGGDVLYHRTGERHTGPSFTDQGRRILIRDLDRDSVLAALQLSAQKWGTFQVFGPADYKSLCTELAAEHGFRITNPELQEGIGAEREARRYRAPNLELGHRCSPARPEHDHATDIDRQPAPEPAAPLCPSDGPSAPNRRPVRDVDEAYQRHFEEMRRSQPGREDVSRTDALVAVRLRVTGYGRYAVEQAIRQQAPKLRPNEARDWDEYARRAAGHAFGVSSERDIHRLVKVRDAVLSLEGRPRPKELSVDMPKRRGPDLGS